MARGTRGMGRVYKRGNVYWIAYYTDGQKNGKKARVKVREAARAWDEKRKEMVTSRPIAVALLKKRHEEMSAGRTIREAEKVLLSDLRKLIESDYVDQSRRSGKRLAQCWNHLETFFGKDAKAISIRPTRIAAYKLARIEGGAAPATIKNELAALKHAFRLAVKSEALLANECPAFPTITVNNTRKGFFEADQHERLKACLPSDEADLVEFLYWSAARTGEAKGLRWADVDRGVGVLRIEQTKNGEPRTLPYGALPALRDLIERRHAITEEVQKKRGMVVSNVFHRNGDAIRYFRRSWITACKKAGVPGRIPHDYRRSAARNMLRAGLAESDAMAIGGWKTRSVFDRYSIKDEAVLRRAFEQMAEAAPVVSESKVSVFKAAK